MDRLILVVLTMLIASSANAERFFAESVGLETTVVAGAVSYVWQESLDGAAWQPLGTSHGVSISVRAPWGVPAVYRVAALVSDGGAGPWSDESDVATWSPNPVIADGEVVRGRVIARVARY